MKLIAIAVVLVFILTSIYNRVSAQNSAVIDREDEYLEKMKKKASDFETEDEKLVFLADHIDEIDTYYYLASDLSKIKQKSPALNAALCKKILQCFIHYNSKGDRKYSGILDGIFKNSPDIKNEYELLLVRLVERDHPSSHSDYLKSISLFEETDSSALFSVQDKVRILAYKYLLKMNPFNQEAANYFMEYGGEKNISDYEHYFIVQENEWSGEGILNEHGEWILYPFFDLYDYADVFNEGFGDVIFVRGIYPGAKSKGVQNNYSSYGNWIDKKGEFLLDTLVPNQGSFSNGKARCFDNIKPKYIDANGDYIIELEGKRIKSLKNGYTVLYNEDNAIVEDENGGQIAKLDKKFNDIRYLPKDELLSYGYHKGWPGDGKYGYLSLNGDQLTSDIYHTNSDREYAPKSFNGKNIMVNSLEWGKNGLINRAFEILIPYEYQSLEILNDKYVLGKNGEVYTLFDTRGNQLFQEIPVAFLADHIWYEDGLGIATTKGQKQVVDEEGKSVTCFEGYEITGRQHGKYLLKNDNSKYGVFDKNCEPILPFLYDEILIFSKEIALAKKNGSYYSINLETKEEHQFPKEYKLKNRYKLHRTMNFIQFEKDGKQGIVEPDGKIIIPFHFMKVSYRGNVK